MPIVRLLFESGEFTSQILSLHLRIVVLCPWPHSSGWDTDHYSDLLLAAGYSDPVKIGLVTVIINFVLSVLFLRFTGLEQGYRSRYSITSVINMLTALLILRRKLGAIDARRIVLAAVKALTACAWVSQLFT